VKTLRLLLAAAVATALPALAPAPAHADNADLVTTPIAFANNTGETLHGLVYAPRTATGPLPGMVLLAGSGRTSHRTLATEAKAFAAQGIAVLAYDKRTAGYSDAHRDYAALADDAVAAVKLLRTRPGVDAAHVGIWGISEGGWVGPLAAARSNDIAFLVVASAPGLTPMRTEVWNTRNKIHAAGVRGSLVAVLSDRSLRLLENAGTFAESRYDPRPTLARVTQPVLAVYGSEDVQVPPAESAEVFQTTVHGNLSIRIVAGADHLLRVQHPDGREDTAHPGYPDLVGAWVKGVASGTPPPPVVDPLPAQRARAQQIPPSAWWEAWPAQLVCFALVLLLPLTYPVWALARRIRGRRVPGIGSARTLAALAPTTALAGLVYLYAVLTGSDYRGIYPGPVLAGRPIGWLAVQLLALATLAAAAVTAGALARRRHHEADRKRLAVLAGGAAIFVPWALYWGLLLP
jgi:pimeloyl-ACP methyl ester carboxylesterase